MDRTNEELCLLIQSGDQQAKQELCNKNKRLIEKVASKYVGMYGNDLDAEDLVQVGYLGLLTAAEKYDAGNEAKFSTYAVHWIKREIKREIRECGFTIRLPDHVMARIEKCTKLDTSFQQQGLERAERVQAIADTLDMTVEEVKKYLSMRKQYQQCVSLNTAVDEESETEIHELIPDEATPPVEDVAEKNDMIERLYAALPDLTAQERDIIEFRYGLNGNRICTIAELSVKYGLSEERIRQIEEKALKKLRFQLIP